MNLITKIMVTLEITNSNSEKKLSKDDEINYSPFVHSGGY